MSFDRWDKRTYLQRLGDAISQFVNVALLNGMTDESISGRCWRNVMLHEDPKFRWELLFFTAEFLMYPIDKGQHCKLAYQQDIARSQQRSRFLVIGRCP